MCSKPSSNDSRSAIVTIKVAALLTLVLDGGATIFS
jgi:hypothetical protein